MGSVNKGIVSAVDRDIRVDTFNSIEMFQVDCAVNQGNSGGPIFNMNGEVIGIVSAKYASDMIEGLGFCIPIDDVTEILPDLIKYGKVSTKPYIGIMIENIESSDVVIDGIMYVARIASIDEGSPAEKYGLQIGDIVTKIGDVNVTNVSELLAVRKQYKAGEEVVITVYRDGEYITINMVFGSYVKDTTEE